MRAVSLVAGRESSWPDKSLPVRPVLVLQAAILLLVVANVGRIPVLDLGDRAAPLLVTDIGVMAALTAGGLAMLRARSMRLDNVSIAALAFIGVGALSAIAGIQRFGFSALELLGSLAYLARWCVYFGLYVVVINCVQRRDVESVWSALEAALMIIVVFGIFQSIFLPNFAFMVYPDARESIDFDSQRNRLVSTILDPNIAAGLIVVGLLVQLARLSTGAREPLWKPVVMFAGLVLTLSRGGILSFLTGLVALIVLRGLSARVLKFGVLVLTLTLAALPRLLEFASQFTRFSVSDSSAMARVMIWQRAFSTFLENPWFGIGFNTYGFVQERRGFERLGGAAYSAEGGLLFIAVMTGVVGLLAYLAMLWFVFRRARSARRNATASNDERGLLLGTAVATIAALVNSIFTNSLLTPWLMEPLWVLWGLVFVIASALRRGSQPGSVATST